MNRPMDKNCGSLNVIAAAVDFSNCSLHALETAIFLAKKHHAKLHIIHVIEPFCLAENNAGEQVLGNLKLTTLLQEAVTHQLNHEAEKTEVEGIPYIEITKWTRQHPCDLLIIGSHGWSGSRDLYIGTNAYGVLKFSSCPVLMLPLRTKIVRFEKILLAHRPLTGTMHFFKLVRNLLNEDASVELFYQHYQGKDSQKSDCHLICEERKGDKGTTPFAMFYPCSKKPSFATEIICCANSRKAELLVLTPSLSHWSKIGYVDPEVQKLVHWANLPILYLMNSAFFADRTASLNLSRF